jgi:tetratricopeptide (TPR) repeat protein
MELEGDLYRRVKRLSEQGNRHMEAEAWDKAVSIFDEALELLPEPKNQWEAALWLHASIGDACFMKGDFARAKEALFDALNCPDGNGNPFVLIRLGEVLLELGDTERAKEYLLRAYMLEGKGIFEAEDPKYLLFLEEHFDLEE